MKKNTSSHTKDESCDTRLNELADEFLARLRAGFEVDVEDFASQHEYYEDDIRELFPALIALEQARPTYFGDGSESQCDSNDLAIPDFDKGLLQQLGPYKIKEFLGRGGMGVVYLAEHTELNRLVALKILPNLLAVTSEMRDRFSQEATAMAQLQHQNIVQLYESGVGSVAHAPKMEIHYLAIQYVPGESLDKLLNRTVAESIQDSHKPSSETRGLEESQTVGSQATRAEESFAKCDSSLLAMSNQNRWKKIAEIGIQVANALSHSHDKEILHRDIKPSNLILDSNCKVWVTDFGLAKFMVDEATATKGIVGTLRFMPPERFRGWADPRSDIYSLGATLYELATLEKAYPDEDRNLLVSKIVESATPKPRIHAPEIPRDLETIILTCMNGEPANRYQTAESLADDLNRFLDGLPVKARRAGQWTQLRSWIRRNPIVASLTSIVLVLVIAIGIGSFVASIQFSALANDLRVLKDNAQNSLLLAYENEADSYTLSGRVGQRIKSLEAIQNGVNLLPKVEHTREDILRLRNSCIAAITLTDLEQEKEFSVSNSRAAISPDGKYFAWSDSKGILYLQNTDTKELTWQFQFQSHLKKFHVLPFFSPDSKHLFGYSDSVDRLRLFEVRTGAILLELKNSPLDVDSPVAFSKDGKWLAVPDRDRPIRIFDLANPDKPPQEIKVSFPINQLMFLDDDKKMLGYFMRKGNGGLFVHDFRESKSEVIDTGLPDISSVRSIDDRGLFITYGGGQIAMLNWPLNKRHQYRNRAGNTVGSVNTCSKLVSINPWGSDCRILESSTGRNLLRVWGVSSGFANQGSRLAITSESKLKIFKVHSHEPYLTTATQGEPQHYFSPEVGPKGQFLLGVSNSMNVLYDGNSMNLLTERFENGFGGSSKFLADGRIVSVINGQLTIFAVRVNGERYEFGEKKLLSPAHYKGCIATPRTGKRIAWRAPSGRIRVADVDSTDRYIEIALRTRGLFLPLFAMTPDGKKLVVADGTVRVFDTTTGKELHDFGEESQLASRSNFGFSPDGCQVICHSGHDLMLFNLSDYTLEKRFPTRSYRGGAAWSPDGSLLALVRDAETVLIRDGKNYSEIAELRAPNSTGIESIRFSTKGDALYAAAEQLIFRWNLEEIRHKLDEFGLDWD